MVVWPGSLKKKIRTHAHSSCWHCAAQCKASPYRGLSSNTLCAHKGHFDAIQGVTHGVHNQIFEVPRGRATPLVPTYIRLCLSLLASAINDRVGRHVPIKVLARHSTTEAQIHAVHQNPSWMDPIHAYLTDSTVPTDKTEAKTIRRRSARYLLLHRTLY